MKNEEIRRADRKALPKFLLLMVIGAVIGGAAGYCAARYGLDGTAGTIRAAGAFFGTHIAPWLLVAMAVLLPAVCVPVYRGAKRLLAAWDGEDEDISDAVDRKLSAVLWLTGAALILAYFLIAASYSGGFAAFDSAAQTRLLFVGIAAFFAVMAEAILLQQRCVNTAKQTNPEKKASIYDIRFQKKWLDDCDEAEKMLVGRCAFKAYAATNTVCTVLAIVLALCALVFDIGFLPSLTVCLVWLVNLSVYCREAMRYTGAGVRLS